VRAETLAAAKAAATTWEDVGSGRARNPPDTGGGLRDVRPKAVHLGIVVSWALAGIGIGLVQVALTGFAAEWQAAGPGRQRQDFTVQSAIYGELYASVALV
jgi:hypothetical protein